MEVFIVFEWEEIVGTFRDEQSARRFIDDSCLWDDPGTRFEIRTATVRGTLPNHRKVWTDE